MAVYNNVVVTDAGIHFLRDISLTDKSLNAGSFVTSAVVINDPKTATGIPNVVQTLLYSLYAGNQKSFVLEAHLTNQGVASSYPLNTVGFYANDGAGNAVLLAVITAQTPDVIPPETAYPINVNFKAIVILDSSGNVTINASFAGYATIEALNEHIMDLISTETGTHGIRFFDNVLQFWNGEAWEDVTRQDLIERVDKLETQVNDLQDFVGYSDTDILGLEADFANSLFKRLSGANEKSAGVDFDDIECFGGRRRCIVADNGVILAYHGENGYTESGALTVALMVGGANYAVGTLVQVMVYQPRFYYRVVPLILEKIIDGKGFHLRKARYYVSSTPQTGFKLHPAFIKNNIEKPYVLIGAYEACLQQGNIYNKNDGQQATETTLKTYKLASIAGAKPASGLTQRLTRRNCGIIAENRGLGWSQEYMAISAATQLLMVVELGGFNTQTLVAMGVVNVADTPNTTNHSKNTGATSSLGNITGAADGTNGLVSVSYRGQENLWGNIWTFVDGCNIWGDGKLKGGVPYIADNDFVESIHDGKYKSAEFTVTNEGGYVSAFGYGNPDLDWLFISSECQGNDQLPIGDYNWFTPDLNGHRISRLGSFWNSGLNGGGFYWTFGNDASYCSRNIGGRVVFVPQ